MTHAFFSRTADLAVAVALGLAILYAALSIGPVALDRWF
jgi:hypothetical protein